MAKRRKKRESSGGKRAERSARRKCIPRGITVREVPGEQAFELAYPRSVELRADDLQEVYVMLQAGEVEVAAVELRWLVQGCRMLLEAFQLLGEIALADGDVRLARGYFGRAYELGLAALPSEGLPGPLPYDRPPNRPFFEAGKGLACCLHQLGQAPLARQVVEKLLALDPADPLALRDLVKQFDQ